MADQARPCDVAGSGWAFPKLKAARRKLNSPKITFRQRALLGKKIDQPPNYS